MARQDAGIESPGDDGELRHRVDALAHRVGKLEATLASLERHEPSMSATSAMPPAPSLPPAPPSGVGWPAAGKPGAQPATTRPATALWDASAAPAPAAPARGVAAPATGWGAPEAAGPADGWRSGIAPAAPAPGRPAHLTFRELEERFAGRLLAWTGALALVAAAIFFLSLAFSRGWIGEEARVLIGLAVGIAAFTGGAWFMVRHNELMGHVLAAVGIGVFSIAVMAATRLYGLVPPEAGLALALVAAIGAAVLAIRTDARAIAAFGLVAALAAPPLVGASPTLLTLAFVAITLVGTTVIALFRSWVWLPPIAFLLAAPQLASWLLGEDGVGIALVALAGFWLLNMVAAAGEEVRIRRNDLHPTSATLALADAAFLAWGLLVVFDGVLDPWRGVALVVAATGHLLLGAWFLVRQGLDHRFGNLVAGTGAALVALAAIVQLGGSVVPAALALEAIVLTWLAVRLDHRYSAWAALVLGSLSVAWFVAVAYPYSDPGLLPGAPFAHPATVSLVVVTGSLLAAAWLVPVRWLRSTLAGAAVLAAAWTGPFELTGSGLVAWLTLLAVAGVALHAAAEVLPDRSVSFVPSFRVPLAGPAEIAGGIAWAAAAVVAVEGLLRPVDLLDPAVMPAVPLTNEAALQGGLLILGALAVAGISRAWVVRSVALLAALGAAAWLAPFQVLADLVVVAWCGLAVLAWLAGTRERNAVVALDAVAVGLAGLAVTLALVVVAPPYRLMVQENTAAWPPLLSAWPLSFIAIAAMLAAATRLPLSVNPRTWLGLGAVGAVTYGASVGVVAAFQASVGGPVAYEELAKQAQVALSVLWMSLGVAGLVVGLVMHRGPVRDAGLALLALATAKVFLVDLAALDVAYRVLSLAALGLLLLMSAWLFTHFRGGPRTGPSGMPGGTIGSG